MNAGKANTGIAERERSFQDCDWSFPGCLEVQWRHDAEYAGQIRAWREARGWKGQTGPKAVLLAALNAARDELLAAAVLVSSEERASHPVCGAWTLKDVLGHVADWEWLGAEGLRHMAAGHAPQVEHVEDLDAWNQAHVEARRSQPWEEVWADLHAARRSLLEVLQGSGGYPPHPPGRGLPPPAPPFMLIFCWSIEKP